MKKSHYMEYINLFATKNIITLKLFEISLWSQIYKVGTPGPNLFYYPSFQNFNQYMVFSSNFHPRQNSTFKHPNSKI